MAKPIADQQVQELVVFEPYDSSDNCAGNWYATDQKINVNKLISYETFLTLNQSSEFSQLTQQVKFLCIRLPSSVDLDFELLNCFDQLIHLQIGWNFDVFHNRQQLTLPNLHVLEIESLECRPLVLDTPKLEVLHCNNVKNIEFNYPTSIKTLECDYSDEITINKFQGLEFFKCRSIRVPLDRKLPCAWTKLKQLDLDFHHSGILAYASLWKRNVDIYLNDVRLLLNSDQLKDYELVQNRSRFQLKFHDLLRAGSYPEVERLNYSELMSVHPQLNDQFFDLFPSIRIVGVTGAVDPAQFKCFLKKAIGVQQLFLFNTSLGQPFFDSLPDLNSQLTELAIRDAPNSFANFEFVFRLPQLRSFQTNQQVERPLELAERLFQAIEISEFWFRGSFAFCTQIVELSRGWEEGKFEMAFYKAENAEINYNDDEDAVKENEFYSLGKESTFWQDNLTWSELKIKYESLSL